MKTRILPLISSYECDAKTADEEFLLAKRQYQHITGRQQKNNVIAYQIRQSTHIDRKHIHNHIIYNSTSLDYTQVSQLYIAQIKRKCGMIERVNYNRSKKEDAKVPQCPPEKEEAIMDALKHFQII